MANSVSASQISSNVWENLRFDRSIQAFEFKPSLGIVAKSIDKFRMDIRSFREPLKRSVQQVMIPSFRENFIVGGRPSWEPLAVETVRKRGATGPILIRSGKLKRGVTTLSIWTITDKAATIKDLPPRIWYGKVHQGGSAGGRFSANNWFKPYQAAARKVLGPEANQKEIDELGFKMFDRRLVQHGPAPRDAAHIPARPFAVFQEEDIDRIQNIFADWLIERAQRAGVFSG